MRISDIMTNSIESIGSKVTADAAWNRMQLKRIHHLLVMDGASIVGVLSEGDLGGPKGAALRRGQTVADVMSPNPIVATPETTLKRAANLLRGRAIGCLPVVDRDKVVGIVTVSDLLESIGKGTERPIASSVKWTLKDRGPRRRRPGA